MSSVRLLLLTALLVGGTACGDAVRHPTAPDPSTPLFELEEGEEEGEVESDGDADPLRPAADAPSLAQTSVSFYAVRGQARAGRIMYHARPGAADSTEFVHLAVPAQSLLARPDGSLVADGDSVLVTITVIDPTRLTVELRPSGLRFDSNAPAQLRFSFAETDKDVNGDGSVDGRDAELQSTFAVWRQQATGAPWTALPSTLAEQTVSAAIGGFSNYMIAY